MIRQKLRDSLNSYMGEYESFIDDVIIVYDLLLIESFAKDNSHVLGAIAYFAAPKDIMPISVYGPYGFIPLMYVGIQALKTVGIHDFQDTENKCLEIMLESEIEEINNYLGW